jgi:hypothetical protein
MGSSECIHCSEQTTLLNSFMSTSSNLQHQSRLHFTIYSQTSKLIQLLFRCLHFLDFHVSLPSKLDPAGFWRSLDLGVVLQKYRYSLCSSSQECRVAAAANSIHSLGWVPKPLMLTGWNLRYYMPGLLFKLRDSPNHRCLWVEIWDIRRLDYCLNLFAEEF